MFHLQTAHKVEVNIGFPGANGPENIVEGT
jgi:hypothetical protein